MLDNMMKRWLDLLFWWLPKNERSQSERSERAHQAPSAGTSEAAPQRAETEEAQPSRAQARPPPAEERPAPPEHPPAAPPERPAAATTPPRPDDLTVIKGIGPAVQEKLRGLGIATFDDLAAADPDRLLDQLKGSQPVSRARVQGWTEEARARSAPN